MSDFTLFTFGAPFGRWSIVAPAFLGAELTDPAVAKWHDEVAPAPLPGRSEAEVLEALSRSTVAPAMVGRLQTQRPVGAPLWGGADARLGWTATAVTQSMPNAKFLIWVEHPARSLAQWLSCGGGPNAMDAVRLIESSLQHTAGFAHKHRDRCLLVYTDEAIAHGGALLQRLGNWCGVEPRGVVPPMPPALSPLHLALSERLVAVSPRLMREFERLYASCIRLTEAEEPVVQPLDQALGALSVLAALERQAKEGVALAQQFVATGAQAREQETRAEHDKALLLVQLHQMQEETERALLEHPVERPQQLVAEAGDAANSPQAYLRSELARQTRENGLLLDLANNAKRDSDLLLLQLHQMQEEIERKFLDQASAPPAPVDHSPAANIAASRTGEEQLSAELIRQTQENGLLLIQLQQVQEEVEHYYLAYRESTAGRVDAAVRPSHVQVARAELLAGSDAAPHRHLDLVLHDVQMQGQRRPSLLVRLVEHHGRPGLALFQRPEELPPLAAWQPNGNEGDRSFELFLPTDTHGKLLLQHLGSSDWLFVEGVARAIQSALQQIQTAPRRWIVVAQRLVQQLSDMPIRFRYDHIDVATDDRAPDAFIVTFGKANVPSKMPADIRLRWRPKEGDQGTPGVELIRPLDADVPLPGSWPVDDGGDWAGVWRIPLDSSSRTAQEKSWHDFGHVERAFLLGLLDAMPAVAAEASRLGVDVRSSLVAAAIQPRRIAGRLIHGTRMKRIVAAARGHLST